MNSSKKYTVITGASAGIGYAAAEAFAKRGKHLILVARRKDRLDALKQTIHQIDPSLSVIIKVCDLSVAEQVHALYDHLTVYDIDTWINNAGFGDYGSVGHQDIKKIESMLRLNIEALTILSSLYVHDYKDTENTQLINLSSRGGYMIVPTAVTYCATKFYVSVFTEGLAHELKANGAKLQAKVLAPSATKTEFGMVANDTDDYDYDKKFSRYHSSEQMADFLLALYDSDKTVGIVDWKTFDFELKDGLMPYANDTKYNQKTAKD